VTICWIIFSTDLGNSSNYSDEIIWKSK